MYPTYQKPNIILLSFVSLCFIIVIVIFYLIYLKYDSDSNKKHKHNNNDNNRIMNDSDNIIKELNPIQKDNNTLSGISMPTKGAPIENAVENQFATPTAGNSEVFHIKNNIFSYSDAPAVCALYGANLASIEELKKAHSNGADWCSGGWTKEGLVAYPIQQQTYDKLQENDPQNRDICGLPGINLLRNDPDLLYGVNCYGIKRRPIGAEKLKQNIMSDKDLEKQQKMAQFRQLDITLTPYNQDKWSEY